MAMRRSSMLLSAAIVSAIAITASPAAAQDFSLQLGPPIAGNSQSNKSSLLVVRPGGCADPARAQITATAEGLVDGTRRSLSLKVAPLPTPGVHAVNKDWPAGGVWLVNVVGTCAGKTAGALVLMGPQDKYRREAVKLLPRRASTAEIDAALKTLTTGGSQ